MDYIQNSENREIILLMITQITLTLFESLQTQFIRAMILMACIIIYLIIILLMIKYKTISLQIIILINIIIIITLLCGSNNQFITLYAIITYRLQFTFTTTIYIQIGAYTLQLMSILFITNQNLLFTLLSGFVVVFAFLLNIYLRKKRSSKRSLSSLPLQIEQLDCIRRQSSYDTIMQFANSRTIIYDWDSLELKFIHESILSCFDCPQYDIIQQLKIIKVDKEFSKTFKEAKLKGKTLMELLVCLKDLHITQDLFIQIIKTSQVKLDTQIINISIKQGMFVLIFQDLKDYSKFLIKHSCFALMNKLFASFSHEFGTILNQIQLNVQIGKYNLNIEVFQSIQNCCERMHSLVRDLYDFHQIQSKKFQLQIAKFAIREIFDDLQNLYKQQSEQKQIKFQCIETKLEIQQDSQRIKQILINLISNSFKFTPPGGQIKVSAEQVDEKLVRFSVSDTGSGINEQSKLNLKDVLKKNQLFINDNLSQGTAGLGLGLMNSNKLIKNISISKECKEILQFESSVNQGSVFFFNVQKGTFEDSPHSSEQISIRKINKKVFFLLLPTNLSVFSAPKLVRQSQSEPEKVFNFQKAQINRQKSLRVCNQKIQEELFEHSQQQNRDSVISDQMSLVQDYVDETKTKIVPSLDIKVQLQPTYQQQKQILLVDDEIFNITLLQKLLQIMGYESDYALNGIQALEMLDQHLYTLILMDINMPFMNGFEATRRIVGKYKESVTVIACSAFQDVSTKNEALACGMKEYLEKPINKEKLHDILKKYLYN